MQEAIGNRQEASGKSVTGRRQEAIGQRQYARCKRQEAKG